MILGRQAVTHRPGLPMFQKKLLEVPLVGLDQQATPLCKIYKSNKSNIFIQNYFCQLNRNLKVRNGLKCNTNESTIEIISVN